MKPLSDHVYLDHTPDHIHIEFTCPHTVMSSAVLNGGIVRADHIINLRVPKHLPPSMESALEPPETTLERYCDQHNWKGTTVGMMTAASMNSLRISADRVEDIEIIALVTSGLSNPLRAGDPAKCRNLEDRAGGAGTVNAILLTTACLKPAAMVEAIMIATEAKAAAFQLFDIRSRVSNKVATGTGTDAIALACRPDSYEIKYCGKHLIFGELLGRLMMETLTSTIRWELERNNEQK